MYDFTKRRIEEKKLFLLKHVQDNDIVILMIDTSSKRLPLLSWLDLSTYIEFYI